MTSHRSLFRPGALLAALATAALTANPAHAVELPFNVMTPLPGTTVAAEPQLAGLILEDLLTPFEFMTATGPIRGQVQSRVVRSNLDDTLDFYWRVFSDTVSASAIQHFQLRQFVAPESPDGLRADWRIDGLGAHAPLQALAAPSDMFFFSFSEFGVSDGLAAGHSSRLFFLDTQATHYALTGEMQLFRYQAPGTVGSGFMTTFAPAAAVPEPGTWALMALGLLPLLRRRLQGAAR